MRIELDRTDYGDDGIRFYPHKAMTTRKIVTMHLNGNEVSIKTSSKLTGNNKVSGKKYWRWTTDDVVKIRRGARGQMVPYHYFNGKHYGGWTAYYAFQNRIRNVEDKIPESLVEQVQSLYRLTEETMPLNGTFGLPDYTANPNGTFDLYQREPADFVRTVFGKSRYRKDLVRTVFESNIDIVLIAATMRDRVPIDWLIGFMKEMKDRDAENQIRYPMERPLAFREVSKKLDERVLRRLLRDSEHFSRYEVADVMRFSDRINNVDGVRTWTDLHYLLNRGRRVPRYNRQFQQGGYIRADLPYTPPPPPPDVVIEPTYITKKLIDAFMGSKYVLVPASDSEQLRGWSNEMGNCIRSYDQVAARGETNLGGLYVDEKLLANYEVDEGGRLKQLLGKFNQNLPDEHRLEIEQLMIKAGVNVVHYWGKPDPYSIGNVNQHREMGVPAPLPIDMMDPDW